MSVEEEMLKTPLADDQGVRARKLDLPYPVKHARLCLDKLHSWVFPNRTKLAEDDDDHPVKRPKRPSVKSEEESVPV